MAEQTESTHILDAKAQVNGWVRVAYGGVVFAALVILGIAAIRSDSFTDQSGVVLLVFALLPLGVLCFGVWSLLIPTALGVVKVTTTGLELTLRRDRRISLPWTAIDHWGLAPRRIGQGRSLVAWPTDDVAAETRAAADRLWSERLQGWRIERLGAGDDLIADLQRLAPCDRRDWDPKG